jgi:DNA-binding response OmpR family regulator
LPASFLTDLGVEMIPKPLDPDTLLRAVRAVLDAGPQAQSAP